MKVLRSFKAYERYIFRSFLLDSRYMPLPPYITEKLEDKEIGVSNYMQNMDLLLHLLQDFILPNGSLENGALKPKV